MKKTARNQPETALKPVPVRPLLESTKFDDGHFSELSNYYLPLNLRSEAFK
jgi:hypothetical protein